MAVSQGGNTPETLALNRGPTTAIPSLPAPIARLLRAVQVRLQPQLPRLLHVRAGASPKAGATTVQQRGAAAAAHDA